MLEFTDQIERRETIPDKPEAPLSERTRLLAMMAATIACGENPDNWEGTGLANYATAQAKAIPDAVEKGVI